MRKVRDHLTKGHNMTHEYCLVACKTSFEDFFFLSVFPIITALAGTLRAVSLTRGLNLCRALHHFHYQDNSFTETVIHKNTKNT